MTDHIAVQLEGRIWTARFSDPAVRQMFGTDTLPTAYTIATPAEAVLAALRTLNPHSHVELAIN